MGDILNLISTSLIGITAIILIWSTLLNNLKSKKQKTIEHLNNILNKYLKLELMFSKYSDDTKLYIDEDPDKDPELVKFKEGVLEILNITDYLAIAIDEKIYDISKLLTLFQ